MEELEITEERSGFFSRMKSWIGRGETYIEEEEEGYEDEAPAASPSLRIHANSGYSVSLRKEMIAFQDAKLAADAIRRGEEQILNLNGCEPKLREKIKDFLSGVNYACQGTWEEVAENVYLIAPANAKVNVVPASPRMAAQLN